MDKLVEDMRKVFGDIAIDLEKDRKELAKIPHKASVAVVMSYQTATEKFHTEVDNLLEKGKQWSQDYNEITTQVKQEKESLEQTEKTTRKAKADLDAAREKVEKQFDVLQANNTLTDDLHKSWDTEKAQLKAQIEQLKRDEAQKADRMQQKIDEYAEKAQSLSSNLDQAVKTATATVKKTAEQAAAEAAKTAEQAKADALAAQKAHLQFDFNNQKFRLEAKARENELKQAAENKRLNDQLREATTFNDFISKQKEKLEGDLRTLRADRSEELRTQVDKLAEQVRVIEPLQKIATENHELHQKLNGSCSAVEVWEQSVFDQHREMRETAQAFKHWGLNQQGWDNKFSKEREMLSEALKAAEVCASKNSAEQQRLAELDSTIRNDAKAVEEWKSGFGESIESMVKTVDELKAEQRDTQVGTMISKFVEVLQPVVKSMESGNAAQRSMLMKMMPEDLDLNSLLEDLNAMKSAYDTSGTGRTRPPVPVFGPQSSGTADLSISPVRPSTSGTDTTAMTVDERINEQNKRQKARVESDTRSKREKLAPQPYEMTSDAGKRILQRCKLEVTFSDDSAKMYWLLREIDNIGKRKGEVEFHRLIQTAIIGAQVAAPTPPYCLICKLTGKGTITADDKHHLEDCKNCAADVKSRPKKSEDRVSVYAVFAEGKTPAHAERMDDGKLRILPSQWEFEEGDDVLYVIKERTHKVTEEAGEEEVEEDDSEMYS